MTSVTKAPPPLVTPSPLATQAQPTHPPVVEKSSSEAVIHPVKKKDEKGVGKKVEKKEAKKKKGLFANFRKKLKSGGKSEEVMSVDVKGDTGRSEVGKGGGASGGSSTTSAAVPEQKDKMPEEDREEMERQELYKAIGYSEDEEYVEYPKEVSHIWR